MWIKTADRLPENEQIVLLMMRRTGYRITIHNLRVRARSTKKK